MFNYSTIWDNKQKNIKTLITQTSPFSNLKSSFNQYCLIPKGVWSPCPVCIESVSPIVCHYQIEIDWCKKCWIAILRDNLRSQTRQMERRKGSTHFSFLIECNYLLNSNFFALTIFGGNLWTFFWSGWSGYLRRIPIWQFFKNFGITIVANTQPWWLGGRGVDW